MKKVLTMFLATAIFIVGFAAHSAYADFFGGKWGKYGIYYDFKSEVHSSFKTPTILGARSWNGKANIALWEVISNYPVDIWVQYDPNDAYWASRGYYGFGEPGPSYSSGTYTSGTLSIVNSYSSKLSALDKQKMLAHEFGHLLGLSHVEDSIFNPIKSIMDEGDVFDKNVTGPQAYDIANLKKLYP